MENSDPYIRFTQDFFKRWSGLYDWFAFSIAGFYRAVAAAVPIDSSIIEICVGTGQLASRLAARGAVITGIDISEHMLAKAAVRTEQFGDRVKLVRMDARKLDFETGSFGTAICCFCLHDMPRKVRLEVLSEAKRVASGQIIVADYEFPHNRIANFLYRRGIALFETPYFKSFAAEGIPPLLTEAGLEIVSQRRLFAGMFSMYSCRRRDG